MEINATIIVQLAVVLTLMLWLSKVLFAPLMRLFDEREARIQGAKEQAKALEEQGQHKLAYVEERMKVAQREAREMLTGLKAEGAAYHRKLIDSARAEAREKLEAAKQRIQGDLDKARSEMLPLVEENAALLVARFVATEPSSSTKSGNTKMEFRSA
jgi:F-type H+-transporting ATPase subunit b